MHLEPGQADGPDERHWSLLSSHGAVLCYLAGHPEATLRRTSDTLDLTERHVHRVINDLKAAGLVTSELRGRRNVYTINPNALRHHPTFVRLGYLLAVLVPALTEAASQLPLWD